MLDSSNSEKKSFIAVHEQHEKVKKRTVHWHRRQTTHIYIFGLHVDVCRESVRTRIDLGGDRICVTDTVTNTQKV